MNATLQFRIDSADPRVLLSGLRWFYSEQLVNSISQQETVEEITNRTNRTSESELVTSFSSDGVYFNITVVNIAQERLGGEETDRGRYFLQATNPAGSSVAFIALEVYGTLMNCQMWWYIDIVHFCFRTTTYYQSTSGWICHYWRYVSVPMHCSGNSFSSCGVDLCQQ